MSTFRKFLTGFFSILLYVTLIAGATAVTITLVFSQPESLETMLVQSKLYDNFVESTLEQASKSSTNSSDGFSIADPAVQAAAKEAFAPAVLEKDVNAVIEANYAWLQGKTDKPEFTIDLSEAKVTFAGLVGKAVKDHLQALPVCTNEQLATLNYAQADLLTLTCRPANISPTTEGARIETTLASSDGFLEQTTFTADSIGQQGSEPYYKKAAFAPQVYHYATYAPYAVAGVSALLSIIIVFVAVRKRNGLRAISIVYLISGIVLIGMYLGANVAYNKFHTQLFNDSSVGNIQQSLTEFLHQLQVRVSQDYLYIGLGLIALSAIGFIVLLATRNRRKPAPKASQHAQQAPNGTLPAPVAPQQPDSPQRPATTAPTLSAQPRTNPSAASKPKRPRLIQ